MGCGILVPGTTLFHAAGAATAGEDALRLCQDRIAIYIIRRRACTDELARRFARVDLRAGGVGLAVAALLARALA